MVIGAAVSNMLLSDCVSQLHLLGMQAAVRGALLKELLHRHAAEWAGDAAKRDFLQDLGVPPAWTAEALAVLARNDRNREGANQNLTPHLCLLHGLEIKPVIAVQDTL